MSLAVIDNNSLEVLLGVDWFKASKAGIFPSEGSLYIDGKRIRLDDKPKVEVKEEIALEVVDNDEFEESPDCLEFDGKRIKTPEGSDIVLNQGTKQCL